MGVSACDAAMISATFSIAPTTRHSAGTSAPWSCRVPLAFGSAPRFNSVGTTRMASLAPSSAAHARRNKGGPSVPSAATFGSFTGDRFAGGLGSGPSCSSSSSGETSYLTPVPVSSLSILSSFPARGVATASTASLTAPRAAASASKPAFLARYTAMRRSYIASVAR